jgi:hypothetical protein
VIAGRLANLQGFGLEPRRDLGIAVGRFGTGVPQPSADDVDFDTGLEEVDGCRVSAMSLAR